MAQAPLTEEQKRELERRQKGREQRGNSGAAPQDGPRRGGPPPDHKAEQRPVVVPKAVQPPPQQAAPVTPKAVPSLPPKAAAPANIPPANVPPSNTPPSNPPPQKAFVPPPIRPTNATPGTPATPNPGSPVIGAQPAAPQFKAPMARPDLKASAGQPPPPSFGQLQTQRKQTVEDNGRRTVIQEPGNRVIIKQDNRVFVQHNEAARFQRLNGAETVRRPNGVTETFYVRPDGMRIVTEIDANGRMLRRYRRGPDGREHNIVDNRNFWRNAGIGAGVAGVAALIALNLPPPRVTIPRDRYIVDYDRASDEDIYDALSAPPVDALDRAYSLEEIRFNRELRDRMRRIDLDTITFDFGAYEVGPEQYPRLERLARSMNRLIDRNPDEVFLAEGHTDAVGSDIDNASLSDRRAEAVAHVLTDVFGIPPENLVTQGYGEQYLKVPTQGPERQNRRVAVRRITPLMAQR